jgi:N-carbamoyl-L-amino-acid hydrolase
VVETAEQLLDQRHVDGAKLGRMLAMAKEASLRFAAEEQIHVEWERIWRIDPIPFHPELIELAEAAVVATCGTSHRLPSGPLHDAAEVARAGIPTVMLFVQSLRGISHNKIEDTLEQHLIASIEAFDRLADATISWIQRR